MRSNIAPQGAANNYMQLIYENTLSSASNSINITGLTGDTAEIYELVISSQTDYDGTTYGYFAFNSDFSLDKGIQRIAAADTTTSGYEAVDYNIFGLFNTDALDRSGFSHTLIYAKSGVSRFVITSMAIHINATSINHYLVLGGVWDNSADEITSININTTQANGFGIGSYFALYAKGVVA